MGRTRWLPQQRRSGRGRWWAEVPRVCVTTVMKDEPPEFIERWAAASQEADLRLLIDTGSENDAIEVARDCGVSVHEVSIYPWRFDVARNAGLALIPREIDLVFSIDVDEVLEPGWRDAVEDALPGLRFSYDYVWNHDEFGNPDMRFSADHCHSRYGWQWQHPVHEALYWVGGGPEPETQHLPLTVTHRADPTKSRAQYLPLLLQAVAEDPSNDRMAHYCARELFFRGLWVQSREEFIRHLALPSSVWPAERAQSYRFLAKMDDYPERWLLRAAAEDSGRREVWVDLAEHWLSHGETVLAAAYARRALMILNRRADYLSEARAWDDDYLRSIAVGEAVARTLPVGDSRS